MGFVREIDKFHKLGFRISTRIIALKPGFYEVERNLRELPIVKMSKKTAAQ